MSQKLFIFIGNDETLKNQLYYQITGINQLEKEENYNCFPSFIKKPPQFQEKKYQILNTPPIKTKEDHKKLWSLIAAICQCRKLNIEDVFYCMLNQNQLNLDILNDLTDLFYYNFNKNGISFFTKSIDAQNQISSKIKNQICYLCRNPTDFLNIFEQLSRRQNKFFFTLYRIEKLMINENDEIICLINAISNELKKLLIQPINQVQFIQKFFQKEQLESILNSIYFNFDKIQSIFESRVKIKLSLDQLYNQIVGDFLKLYTSTFYLCQECLQFYFCEKSILYPINLLKPQILIADSNSNKSKFKCINCQNQISYASYQLIFQACFDDLQQRISLKLQYEFENQLLYIQKPNTEPLQEMHNVYQETNLNRKIIENENIKLNDATQILFLSNEDDQKRIIFNTLIEYKNQNVQRLIIIFLLMGISAMENVDMFSIILLYLTLKYLIWMQQLHIRNTLVKIQFTILFFLKLLKN